MSLEEICALPVAELAADDAALFLWVVQPMLPEAERVIKAWGFTFKTVAFVWIKMPPSWTPESPRHEPRLGLGYHTRSGAEQCWLAVRGRGYRRQAQGVPQVLHAPIRRHSQKPDEIATRIERLVGDVPRVELFARGRRDGWRRWGNEIDKFDGAPRRAGNQNHRAKSAPSRREGLTRFLSDRIPRIAEKRGPCP